MSEIRIEPIDPQEPSIEQINRVLELLEEGGVIVAPTETRYGLLARADKQIPAERLRRIKARSPEKPVAVFVGSVELIMHYARLNPAAQRLARFFLPGPLTLVVPAIGTWDKMIVPEEKIGIRVSSSPVIQALMERADFPLTATSANLSGADDNGRIEEIIAAFGDQVDLYLDGGPLVGATSTVVDCSDEEPLILRQGAIEADVIAAALQEG